MWDQKNHNFNSSYFPGSDGKHGWGNTTFFSFFSQFNRSSSAYGIVEATVFSFLFLLSLYFNTVVFAHLICNRRMRTVTNSFICNLTIADMFLTFGAPMIAVTRVTGSWIFGSWACSMMVYTEFVCGFVGIWTMTLIGLDRYICIVGRSVTRLTQRSALCILLVVWISALVCFLPMILYFDTQFVRLGQSHVTICTLIWPRQPKIRVSIIFTTILLISAFIIPFVLLTWSYVNIFRRFWTIRQTVVKPQKTFTSTIWMSTLDFKKRRDKRDFRIVKTLFSLLVFFFVMWTPVFIVFVFIVADQKMIISSQVFVFTIAMCMGNAIINPLYYGMMVERLRARLRTCFNCSTLDAESNASENGRIRAISDGIVSDAK
ncbi:free fatty acid receptor 4-like [Gigantopelta aegis]|uniref:free fatty acid receptor 4-like n=1 Tax=Gigantopelta aegis TaxID=1735272 RepID=UPI001B889A3B|nr:free fatty acid receptor 4-like [Gigantopelta aegis]